MTPEVAEALAARLHTLDDEPEEDHDRCVYCGEAIGYDGIERAGDIYCGERCIDDEIADIRADEAIDLARADLDEEIDR